MREFCKLNHYIIQKLIIFFLVSANLSSPKAYADGEFFFPEFIPQTTPKLINPIYLNTNKSNKKTLSTTIPHQLRGDFDEADYFSSSAHDMNSISFDEMDLKNLPSPTEYKTVHYKPNETNETKTVFISESEKSFENENNINTKEEIIKPFEIVDDLYVANLASDFSDENIEGKKISKIMINGLKAVSVDKIMNCIQTQVDNKFNTEIIQKDLQNIYSLGFFTDEMSVEPILNTDDTVTLVFNIKENLLINNVSIIGNNEIPTSELLPLISGLKNLPQNINNINHVANSIKNYYNEKGYILAKISSIDDDANGNLVFNIQEGIINQIQISGNEKTKDYIIERNIMTKSGTVYNEECLKKDLSKIFSTQIFEEVTRETKPCEGNNGLYDVTIIVKEKSTNSIGFGGGIDTGLGAFGSINFKEDNFLSRAQKLSLSGILGSGILLNDASIKNHMNYQAELSFFEPYFINADNSLMSKLYFREMGSWNIPLAIEQRIGFKTGIQHKVKGYDHLTTSLTAGIEHIDMKEGDFNKISQQFAKYGMNISERAKQLTGGFFFNLTPGIRYANIDNYDVPREGIIAQAQFNEAFGISNFNNTHGKLSGSVTKFFPVLKKSSISLTGKAGIKVHGDNMPEVLAYRLGGPYSIRGFRMHGVGAGDSFIMGSAEFATPLPLSDRLNWEFIKKTRLTFFVDAGKVFDPVSSNILYDRPLHAITAGIGLRVYIPGIGPMSIDYGLPLINPGEYGSEHGYFTFGAGGLNGYNY